MTSLQIIEYSTLTIASFTGMVRYKKLTIPFRILALSLPVTVALEIFARFLALKFQNNAFAYHLMSINGYIFYSLVYYFLYKSKKPKRLVLISIPTVITFFFLNLLFIQQYKVFPTNVYLVTNSLYIILSLLLFKQLLQGSLEVAIVRQGVFWFNTAILFYSATMFLHMALLNYYAQHKWGYDIIFYIWAGNFILFYTLIATALFLDKKEYESKKWELMT